MTERKWTELEDQINLVKQRLIKKYGPEVSRFWNE
jgi:hypothetical protein